MLVLARKVGQSIVINDLVSCRVLKIDGEYVQVVFEAPSTIPILDRRWSSEFADQRREAARRSSGRITCFSRWLRVGFPVIIGDDSWTAVMGITQTLDRNCRFGIEAPRIIPVNRLELIREIQEEPLKSRTAA